MIKDPCARCGERWVQSWNGQAARLCRRCAREIVVARTIREIEAERVAKREAEFARKRVPDTGPRPTQEKVINGEVFEVVWDGS